MIASVLDKDVSEYAQNHCVLLIVLASLLLLGILICLLDLERTQASPIDQTPIDNIPSIPRYSKNCLIYMNGWWRLILCLQYARFSWLTKGDTLNCDVARVYTNYISEPCWYTPDWNGGVVTGTRLEIDHMLGLQWRGNDSSVFCISLRLQSRIGYESVQGSERGEDGCITS